MSHSHATMLPRGALALAAGMVVLALTVTIAARVTNLPPSASPVALRATTGDIALVSRDLRFTDQPDGSVMIEDVAAGTTAGGVPAGSKSGFIRGVMRGLARDRHKRGIGDGPPFRLTLWRDGELSLTDSATGRTLELTAFGTTNRAAFAALLPATPR